MTITTIPNSTTYNYLDFGSEKVIKIEIHSIMYFYVGDSNLWKVTHTYRQVVPLSTHLAPLLTVMTELRYSGVTARSGPPLI